MHACVVVRTLVLLLSVSFDMHAHDFYCHESNHFFIRQIRDGIEGPGAGSVSDEVITVSGGRGGGGAGAGAGAGDGAGAGAASESKGDESL